MTTDEMRAEMVGGRVFIQTMGGDYAGTLRGFASSTGWTLLSDTRPMRDKARLVGVVELDGPRDELAVYDGARIWPLGNVHPLADGHPIADDGRVTNCGACEDC